LPATPATFAVDTSRRTSRRLRAPAAAVRNRRAIARVM
jgi:hypothetical protein